MVLETILRGSINLLRSVDCWVDSITYLRYNIKT